MMNKHNYSCDCSLGNMSEIETEMMKEAIIKFLDSFLCKEYKIEKIDPLSDNRYYYEINIQYTNISMLKVKRFSNSLIQFCLFWHISIHENFIN